MAKRMATTRLRGACPRCSRDVALVGKAGSPAQHKCLDGICWPRSDELVRALVDTDGRPVAARMEFTGAEHAMFAEILLTGHDSRYESRDAQVAAAAVHAQLALVAIHAADVLAGWAAEATRYEWAQCLAVRSPADTADRKSEQGSPDSVDAMADLGFDQARWTPEAVGA